MRVSQAVLCEFVRLAQQQQVLGTEICCGGLPCSDIGEGLAGDGADECEEGVLP